MACGRTDETHGSIADSIHGRSVGRRPRLFNPFGLDQQIFRWINGDWHTRWLDALAHGLSYPPLPGLWFLALALLVVRLRGRAGLLAVLLVGVAVGVTDLAVAALFKPWIDRLRPCFALADVHLLVPRQPRSPSFPSGHAANCFAAATVLAMLGPGVARVAYLVAALVALSRVYLGVHYPLDIVAGALLGHGIGLTVRRVPGAIAAVRFRSDRRLPNTKA
jgi:undecaprenyl-diphosphatase